MEKDRHVEFSRQCSKAPDYLGGPLYVIVIITLDLLVEAVGIGTKITFINVSPYIDEVATLCISR
jgi:hypothetical protein